MKSVDGVKIAFTQTGSGPPLVLVHGGVSDHLRWTPVLEGLSRSFTVFAIDRRGRGESGDAPEYDAECEYRDIAAVVRHCGSETRLLGHSYGALCSLEAARLVNNLTHLVLYEPPFSPGNAPFFDVEILPELQALLNADERDALLTVFYRDIVHLSDDDIERLRVSPAWAGRIKAAHTITRELEHVIGYMYQPERFAALEVPTLLLIGERTLPGLAEATLRLNSDIPNSQLQVLPGQDHVAMDTAPEMFVERVTDFLLR